MTTADKILEALAIRDGELALLNELYDAAYDALTDATCIATLNRWHETIYDAIQAEYERAAKEALKGENMQ